MGLRQGRCLLLFLSFRLVECTIAKETLLSNFGHCSVVKLYFKSQAALCHHLSFAYLTIARFGHK